MKCINFVGRGRFRLFLLIISLFSYNENFGQQMKKTNISGKVSNWETGVPDSIEIIVYERSQDIFLLNNNKIYKSRIEDNSFHLAIESEEPILYISFMNLFNSKDHAIGRAKYLVEPGMDVSIICDENGKVKFGSGNYLLNSQLELLSDIDMVGKSLLFDRKNGDRYKYYFNEMELQRERADKILEAYLDYLTPFQYELIKQNYLSYIDATAWWQMGIMAKINELDINNYSEITERMVSVYEKLKDMPSDSIIKVSNTYLEAQVNYNWALSYMNATLQDDSNLWLNEMYKSIKSNYSGFLRDNLLVAALRSVSIFLLNQELIEYIKDALLLIENNDSKNDLLAFLESVTPGTKVKYFEFNTRDGVKVSIEDFKGKVIMAHFWSLGCVPCIEMTKNIHPLIDKYGDNPNVVFLSINVNSSQKHWNSGLSSNLYSHEKELQLNVGELGTSHPLLQYYNYNGVPQLMVIGKDGSLITSNAPRARNLREYDDLESVISIAIFK